MSQLQVTPSQDVVKAPPTFDEIPEDVQLAIIKFIRSWKRSEGTEQERERGKRARDSALRAVALSCRKTFSIYQPQLLFDITLNYNSLFNFYLLLARNRDARKFVRSITFTRKDDITAQEKLDEAENDLQEDLDEISKALTAQEVEVSKETMTRECITEGVYRFLPNIQTLVIQQSADIFPLPSNLSKASLLPVPFLTHSLKKLFIPMWIDPRDTLKGRNVVWILVFCTGLRSASLCCNFDQNDFKYLAEFSGSFSGLSEVMKLSLGVNFTASESIRRYCDKGVEKQWIGGNVKSQAMFSLLRVTKNLQCLELNDISSSAEQGSNIHFSCLSALRSSYLSLTSMRLFGIEVLQADPEECKASASLSLFKKLEMISLDATMLLLLSTFPDIKLPLGLKILCIPYYYGQSSVQEDLDVASLLEVGSFTTLESVIVPSHPISRNGAVSDSDDFKKLWLQGRRELEKAEVFTSGKVKLRIVEPGELIGEASEIDFMSTLSWLSPP